MSYEPLIINLIKRLPFINAVAIIEGKADVVYSTKNWDITQELTNIISSWESRKARAIMVSKANYVMRLFTEDRLIATSTKDNGHIIGVKDELRTIIALIEADGVIPHAFMEMSRVLASLSSKKPYLTEEEQFGKQARLIGKLAPNRGNVSKYHIGQKFSEANIEIMFTARLMAYYRALELRRDSPLIRDLFADRLAGNLSSFLDKHLRYSEMDYPIVRSYYIEENLLKPWCNSHPKSQIVILGAGLDTRAYRFEPLKAGQHKIFEIDFPIVIDYKEALLKDNTPLCDVIRISTDLTAPKWATQLINNGFAIDVPTFWIIEGLVYYMDQEQVKALLTKAKEMSTPDSRIFVDILHASRWFSSFYTQNKHLKVPLFKHLKWGLNIRTIPSFFESMGWNVSCSFADDYDQGRNVGQKAMVFIRGEALKT
jgi:methyltransferase (TIGR00027 family)